MGSGGTGILNVSGGRMTVNGTLKIYSITQINLSNGILEVGSIEFAPGVGINGTLNWTAGALGSLTPLDISDSGMLGANISVTGNRRLFVGRLSDAGLAEVFVGGPSLGVATLSSGGSFTVGSDLVVGIEGAGSFTQNGGTNSVGH